MTTLAADRRRTFMRGLIVAVLGGAFLAITGAFGTDAAPLPLRLTYWLTLLFIGGLWGDLASRAIERFMDLEQRPWLGVAILTVVVSGPLSLVVWSLTGLFFFGRPTPPWGLGHMVGPVVLITAVVSAVNVFVGQARPVQTHATPIAAGPAPFLACLPHRLRGATLWAVQAEDHYLRLHTDRGSDLILMRLSDALVELEGLEGARTHRSWWVARDAVRDVARGDGRATLTLEGGLKVPVSRRYAADLRAAGWY